MKNQSILIIGAGIAGLSAGVYARMNGYDTHIFELHALPGGLCTSWKRSGYVFDGCIHDLAGAGPASKVNQMWQELCPDVLHRIHFHKVITQVNGQNGQQLTVYSNIDRLEAHMKELSPEDVPLIEEYCAAARYFTRHDLFALQSATFGELLSWLPALPPVMKWARTNMYQFAQGFKSPLLREAFPKIQYNMPECPMLIHLAFLARQHTQSVGYPLGGSLAFAHSIARRFVELGGRISYRARVDKILVENDRAVGVRLADGREFRADIVISAGDGRSTIFNLLDGKYTDAFIKEYYASAPDICAMNLQVSLGIKRPLKDLPRSMVFPLPQPVIIAGKEVRDLEVEVYNYDPALAPTGNAVIRIMSSSPYSYWKALSADRAAYEAQKQQVAEAFIRLLEEHIPGLRDDVAVVDVATALTFERYTANHRGLQAWWPKNGMLRMIARGITPTLPGLKNFYMTGQWASGIMGINYVAMGSRRLIQDLSRKDGHGKNKIERQVSEVYP